MARCLRIFAFVACLAINTSVQAADVFLAPLPSGLSVGEIFPANLLMQTSGPEGPGEIVVTIEWGAERASPLQIGAVSLWTLPTAGSAGALTASPNCNQGLGELVGSCTLTIDVDAAIDGVASLANLQFAYGWVPADGYETCSQFEGDPNCVPAEQLVALSGPDATVFGATQPGVYGVTGTLGAPHVRPIPDAVPLMGTPAIALLSLALVAAAFAVRGRGLTA